MLYNIKLVPLYYVICFIYIALIFYVACVQNRKESNA